MAYEPVIGIEVHAQLNTKTKLFSTASNQFGDTPNTNVTEVCLGMPGALPVLNKEAVHLAVMAGLALNCRINLRSVFSRKNYFYPDLPKGYQISQYDEPICEHGYLDIEVNGETKRIGITRIHMEEDAGKLVHQGADAIAGSTHSFVDLNRAGAPLIEIVSEPDIRSAEEARIYVETLRTVLVHMGVTDGNMDRGNLRADANVSIRPVGTTAFGTRTEVKNLNSFRSIERAIIVEMKRQEAVLAAGDVVVQETRNYDDTTQTTTSLRSKEDAHDYRYFPEPDLPPLVITQGYVDAIKAALPELPAEKVKRYIDTFGLSEFECKVLIGDVAMDAFFRQAVSQNPSYAKTLAKWIVGDLNATLKEKGQTFSDNAVSVENLIKMVDLIEKGTISGKMGKELVVQLVGTDKSVETLVSELGGTQISDTDALQSVVDSILKANLDVVEKIKAGKTNSANFLMGQIMKETKGKANPDMVRALILSSVERF